MTHKLQTIPGFDRIGEENAFAVLARATQLAEHGHDIINLGIGQPDFPTPPHITEAAIKALKDGQHGYTPAPGILALREAIAQAIHSRYSQEVSPDNIMIMPGGKVTMFAAILLFGAPGVEILYPDPGFPIYRSMIEFTGANPVPIPIREENGFTFSAHETLSLINDKSKLIILNSPANPTGGAAPKSEIDILIPELAKRPDIAILSDEIYDRIIYDNTQNISLITYPEIRNQLIVLNGWSKTYAMTGWRLGWSIWPSVLYEKVRKLAVNAWSCVNTPTQYAGLAALTGPQDNVLSMVNAFNTRRIELIKQLNYLPNVSCITPKGAFYAFANIKNTGWESKVLATNLLEKTGVATIAGTDFGALGEGYLRLSYANSLENIKRAIERIAVFLNEPYKIL